MYLQQWEGNDGVILALDGDMHDPSSDTWTLHVATKDSYYATSLISPSTFPKECSTIHEITQLLKRSTGTSSDDGQGAWIDLDKTGSLLQIRERSPQGMLRVRWKVSLSKPSDNSMFPFLQLVARSTLQLQSAAEEEKRRTADQSVITENWKRTAQQLEGQWSQEKAILLHNMQILLSEKHKHYVDKIADLQSQLDEATQAAATASKRSHKAPPTPDAPDDTDQLEFDAETVRQLAAGERVKEKKPPTKRKSSVKAKSSLLDKTKKSSSRAIDKQPPAAKKPPAAPKSPPTNKEPAVSEESIKDPETEVMQDGLEPMQVDDLPPKPPPAKSRRRKWEADSSSDDEGDGNIDHTPAPIAPSSGRKGRATSARRKVFESSSSEGEDEGGSFRKRRQGRKHVAAEHHVDDIEKAGKATKANAVDDDDDDILEKLARASSQKPIDKGEMSDSSTEADILKQLESMRH